MEARYRKGDLVTYQKPKYSTHPSHRARDLRPSGMGEGYRYVVEKFWIVADVLEDGRLKLLTRRGKTHLMAPDTPLLRRASLWQRWMHRERFPSLEGIRDGDGAGGEN